MITGQAAVSTTAFLPAERLTADEVRAQARQALESHLLLAMLDTAPGMVALLNPQRQIVLCNEACARAGGLDRDSAVGLRPGELLRCVHAGDAPGGCGTAVSCRHCGLARAVARGVTGQRSSGECLLRCDSQGGGETTEYAVQVRPLPEQGPGWQCYALTDISDEKRREALEHTFFHDILNRAGVVDGVAGLLLEGLVEPAEQPEFLSLLSASARSLVEEIRSQQTLLAAEKGELPIEFRLCDSVALLRQAIEACRASGLAEGKHLVLAPDSQSSTFRTDPALAGRVLLNLLKNALEASSTGGRVIVRALSVNGTVRLSVHNDAVLSDRVRDGIFQRSFSTKGQGRGLGTYSVKLLTERYLGGRVWFEAPRAGGTTFFVEFPCPPRV